MSNDSGLDSINNENKLSSCVTMLVPCQKCLEYTIYPKVRLFWKRPKVRFFLETSPESETFLETAKCDFFGNGHLPNFMS